MTPEKIEASDKRHKKLMAKIADEWAEQIAEEVDHKILMKILKANDLPTD